ncbi:sensor histidine kinase [Desulfonatronum parangueonense]
MDPWKNASPRNDECQGSHSMNAPNDSVRSAAVEHVPIGLKTAFRTCLVLLCLALGALPLALLPLFSISEFFRFQSLLFFFPAAFVGLALVILVWAQRQLAAFAPQAAPLNAVALGDHESGVPGDHEIMDEQVKALKQQLYHAQKVVSVGQIAGEVVHEINNPLAIIDSQSGVIRDMLDPSLGLDASPENIRKELDEIDKAVKRARGITHKVLSFVRKTEPRLQESDVNQLLDDVVSGMKEKEFAHSGIHIVREYGRLPKLLLDPDLIQQMFLNLLNNAGDAMEDGGELTLRTAVEDGRVLVSVADTGHGMSPEQLEQCFNPFFSTKKPGKGTGLGLPICRNIAEDLGGTIEVRSTPGQGTVFSLSLPMPGNDPGVDTDRNRSRT